jgi:two-component system, OmpR family, sensor histidine kinase SenX3
METAQMTHQNMGFTDFLASSIHDMKNSLNIQLGALETIAAQCQQRGDTPTFESLGHVIYQANRMNVNLVQLLSLYKFETSTYPVDISEHPLAETLNEVVLRIKSIMAFKGITLTVDCEPDCYWYFDRELLMGVLINALNNAYNYTTDKIRVSAGIQGGWLELRVEDNGRGYPPGMLMAEGASVNKGVSFASGSTGLGFYFSSQVAHMHKNGDRSGALIIENGGTYGGGCFVVRLP